MKGLEPRPELHHHDARFGDKISRMNKSRGSKIAAGLAMALFLLAVFYFLKDVPNDSRFIAYQGYFYAGPDIYKDYGKVSVSIYPLAVRNPDSNILEFDSPYSLYIHVWSHPNNLRNSYEGKTVLPISVGEIRVLSANGRIIYEDVGGVLTEVGAYAFSWLSEEHALNFPRQALTLEFSVTLNVDGVSTTEAVSIEYAAPEFAQVMKGDYEPPW